MSKFSIVVAMDENNGIGNDGKLPWPSIPSDMKTFRTLTTSTQEEKENLNHRITIMAFKTFYSIPTQYRPLKDRRTIVVRDGSRLTESSTLTTDVGKIGGQSQDLNGALEIAQCNDLNRPTESKSNYEKKIFVIGGAKLFKDALEHPNCNKLYITHIAEAFKCDVFFPKIDWNNWVCESSKTDPNDGRIKFCIYNRKN